MANFYQVLVDDNYHYQDEDERYKLGDFATFEQAETACKTIVDEYLQRSYKKGVTAEKLYEDYVGFGEDPLSSAKTFLTVFRLGIMPKNALIKFATRVKFFIFIFI